ncbi:hypothetical protein HDV05_007217 [Chytridiales sp. JEL 0842]|nr:hypothetical protein HDV05_007217 [Chytridiales sp. JEL 0842]
MKKAVRIGCYSAFWGDSMFAASQLINMDNPPDYIVADYLAEVTMGILARSRSGKSSAGSGEGGYVKEFVDRVYAPNAQRIADRNIKIITNAGGLHPMAAKAAIEQAARDADVEPPIVAAIFGDDLIDMSTGKLSDTLQIALKTSSITPFSYLNGSSDDSDKWPSQDKKILSINAYMGSFPIAAALAQSAQIIITGRVVDSALVVGPLIHEYNWNSTQYDLLAAASLAGHIIECGCHTTGGNFTDWKLSAFSDHGGWANMGYPIVEFNPDGTFYVTKPPKTGGLVTVGTVTEQMVYEVLDPGSYLLPDVILDMRAVTVTQVSKDVVLVAGAKGREPTPYLKTSGVYVDGYKLSGELMIGGVESYEKAKHVGQSIITRVSSMLKKLGMGDFTDYCIECLGSEHTYGKHSVARNTRETILRVTVKHENKMALQLFAREMAPAATCMAPGITGAGSGRPSASPSMAHFSALIPKSMMPAQVCIGSSCSTFSIPYGTVALAKQSVKAPVLAEVQKLEENATRMSFAGQELAKVPLLYLCYARSGDKGDTCNIGVVSRKPEYYPWLVSVLTSDKVKDYMSHLVEGSVERFLLPGSHSLNFVCTKALGGGGLQSLRIDRQGKTYGQMILTMEVEVPRKWANQAPKL